MTSALHGCDLASSASIDWMAIEDGIRESANGALVTQLIRRLFAAFSPASRSLAVPRLSSGISSAYRALKPVAWKWPEAEFPAHPSAWGESPGFPVGVRRRQRRGTGVG